MPLRGSPLVPLLVAAGVLAAAAPLPAAAAGVSCHCFRDRAFDPAQPAKTDTYLLATASNTLLAAAYAYPKGQIVEQSSKAPAASPPDSG